MHEHVFEMYKYVWIDICKRFWICASHMKQTDANTDWTVITVRFTGYQLLWQQLYTQSPYLLFVSTKKWNIYWNMFCLVLHSQYTALTVAIDNHTKAVSRCGRKLCPKQKEWDSHSQCNKIINNYPFLQISIQTAISHFHSWNSGNRMPTSVTTR